jgi:hypothetical protein
MRCAAVKKQLERSCWGIAIYIYIYIYIYICKLASYKHISICIYLCTHTRHVEPYKTFIIIESRELWFTSVGETIGGRIDTERKRERGKQWDREREREIEREEKQEGKMSLSWAFHNNIHREPGRQVYIHNVIARTGIRISRIDSVIYNMHGVEKIETILRYATIIIVPILPILTYSHLTSLIIIYLYEPFFLPLSLVLKVRNTK